MDEAPISMASVTSRASPVWTASGRFCAWASSHHGAGEQQIETIEEHAVAPSGFENGFDAVDAGALQFVHLLARFLGRLGRADELRGDGGAHRLRDVAREFRAVAAFGGEHGAADEKLRA